jgi:hypothetical protein
MSRNGWQGCRQRLSAFADMIKFEIFQPDRERAGLRPDRPKDGRPPFEPMLMLPGLRPLAATRW